MALDTGSGLPYIACDKTCEHCGNHHDPYFKIGQSKTFEYIDCTHDLCYSSCVKPKESAKQRHTDAYPKKDENSKDDHENCVWKLRYVDQSSIEAIAGKDQFQFNTYPYLPPFTYQQNTTDPVSSEHSPHSSDSHRLPNVDIVFGCSQIEAKTIFRQLADGIMGLSIHPRSFVDQLFNHPDYDKVYFYSQSKCIIDEEQR
ncbi:hypothetical protein RFI_06512, partial [Reticulomyxa filosa]